MKFVVIILLIIASALPASAQATRTISVVGRSSMKATPNYAKIELGVLVHGTDPEAVRNKVNQRITAINKKLLSLGIYEESLSTTLLEVSVNSPNDSASGEIMKFEMKRKVRVETRKLDLLERMFETAIGAGANQIGPIQYGTDKQKLFMDGLLEEAADNAKAEAVLLAKKFNAKIGEVIRVESNDGGTTSTQSVLVHSSSSPFGDPFYGPDCIALERSVKVTFSLTK